MLAWIPNLVTFIVMLGVGGKTLIDVPTTATSPATPASILAFASALGATVFAWSTITPDYGVFHDAKGSRSASYLAEEPAGA